MDIFVFHCRKMPKLGGNPISAFAALVIFFLSALSIGFKSFRHFLKSCRFWWDPKVQWTELTKKTFVHHFWSCQAQRHVLTGHISSTVLSCWWTCTVTSGLFYVFGITLPSWLTIVNSDGNFWLPALQRKEKETALLFSAEWGTGLCMFVHFFFVFELRGF